MIKSQKILLFIAMILIGQLTFAQGEKLFKNNCAACHMLDQKMVGPALIGVKQRVMDGKGVDEAGAVDWLKSWIKNSSEMIASGDEYAVKIYEENNKAAMTPFADLSDGDLTTLIDYIDTGKDASAGGDDKKEGVDGEKGKTQVEAISAEDLDSMFNSLIMVVTLLVLIVAVLIIIVFGVLKSR